MLMEQRKRKKSKRSQTKIIPPKKDKMAGLSRDEIRSINKKKIRRKRKFKKILTLAFLFVVVAGVGLALILTVFFKINTIQITGEKVYSDKEIMEKIDVETGTNLFRVSQDRVNKKISGELPYIKSVTIERKLPDTLIINVNATKEIAAIENKSGFILIDETGKVLDKDAQMLREGVAIVKGVSIKSAAEGKIISLKNGEMTECFITTLQNIKKSGLNLITSITISKDGEVRLEYDERIVIKLGSTNNIDKKIERAKAALDRENEINPYSEGVLDLRTEPYAYFSAGKEETTKKQEVATEGSTSAASTTAAGEQGR